MLEQAGRGHVAREMSCEGANCDVECGQGPRCELLLIQYSAEVGHDDQRRELSQIYLGPLLAADLRFVLDGPADLV